MDREHDGYEARPLPRWLPWAGALAALVVIAGTFWATQASRTPAQARVGSIAVAAFDAPAADAATAGFAASLAPALREYLGKTPGLQVPADGAAAEKRVDGRVERRGDRYAVRIRIVDAAGREVHSRSRDWPVGDADRVPFALAREVTAALRLPPPKVEYVAR